MWDTQNTAQPLSHVSIVQCCCHSSLLPYVLSLEHHSCSPLVTGGGQQRPTVLSWQQFLELFQYIHVFLLWPCYSSAQQLHGHLYIICYAGCIDHCCRALPTHVSTTDVCTCHSVFWPELNVQECWCRLCSSRMSPLSVTYVHTAWWHPYMSVLVILSNKRPLFWSFIPDAPSSVCLPKTTQAFQMRKLIVLVMAWPIRMLKWVNLWTVDSSPPAVVIASTRIVFSLELTS